jgi:DNA-binding NarL/FixJ family response regulator
MTRRSHSRRTTRSNDRPRGPSGSRRTERPAFSPTPRESEVLRLVWTGYSNREIADQLGISSRTIEAHRASLMKKLRVGNTAQLVRVAIERGLIKV